MKIRWNDISDRGSLRKSMEVEEIRLNRVQVRNKIKKNEMPTLYNIEKA